MRSRPLRAVLVVAAGALAASVGARDARDASGARPRAAGCDSAPFVVRRVRLFDGDGVAGPVDVYVPDARIGAVGPALVVPAGTAECDGEGRTLLPGLIDAHTHVQNATSLAEALIMGVTTELDMFSELDSTMVPLRRSGVADTARALADLRSAGILVTAPNGHGTEYGFAIPTLASPADADTFVAARIAEGSDYIKIVDDDGTEWGWPPHPTLDSATVAAAVAAAHRHGKLAIVHIGSAAGARVALAAGADGIGHVFADSAPDSTFGRFVAQRGAFVITTLTPLVRLAGNDSNARRFLRDSAVARRLDGGQRTSLAMSFNVTNPAHMNDADAVVRQLRDADVRVLAGTDASVPGTAHGVSLHAEMWNLVHAGLTPVAALRAATSAPADAFRLADRGRVRAGGRADLLLVRGDPTADIHATLDIVQVWKRGVGVDRSGPAEATPTARQSVRQLTDAIGAFDQRGIATPGGTTTFRDPEWRAANDGGGSTARLALVRGGADSAGGALAVDGVVRGGTAAAFAGVAFVPRRLLMSPPPFVGHDGVEFEARGDGGRYRLALALRDGTTSSGCAFAAPPQWTHVRVRFASCGAADAAAIAALRFVAGPTPGPFAFQIDEARLW